MKRHGRIRGWCNYLMSSRVAANCIYQRHIQPRVPEIVGICRASSVRNNSCVRLPDHLHDVRDYGGGHFKTLLLPFTLRLPWDRPGISKSRW